MCDNPTQSYASISIYIQINVPIYWYTYIDIDQCINTAVYYVLMNEFLVIDWWICQYIDGLYTEMIIDMLMYLCINLSNFIDEYIYALPYQYSKYMHYKWTLYHIYSSMHTLIHKPIEKFTNQLIEQYINHTHNVCNIL